MQNCLRKFCWCKMEDSDDIEINGGARGTNNGTGDIQRRDRHFSNMEVLLPEFDTVKDNIDMETWIQKIEDYALLYEWDEIAIRHYALSKLSGVAKKWRDRVKTEGRMWLEWKVLLLETFPPSDSVVQNRLETENYTRKMNQNITEYFFEKLAKCQKAKMEDAEAIEWIVKV